MDEAKKVSIQNIVDREIKKFADSYEARFTNEVNDPEGVINSKKNNCFVAELGKEFMFLVRLLEALTVRLERF